MKHRAFTLIEILIAIAIIAILAALLFPVLASSKRRAKITSEAEALHQIYLATSQYAADHDDGIPLAVNAYTKETLLAGESRYGAPYDAILKSAKVPKEVLSSYGAIEALWKSPLEQPLVHWGGKTLYERFGESFQYDELGALIVKTLSAYPQPSNRTLFRGLSQEPRDWPYQEPVNCLRTDGSTQRKQSAECDSGFTDVPR